VDNKEDMRILHELKMGCQSIAYFILYSGGGADVASDSPFLLVCPRIGHLDHLPVVVAQGCLQGNKMPRGLLRGASLFQVVWRGMI
jgi:hypothetical protein